MFTKEYYRFSHWSFLYLFLSKTCDDRQQRYWSKLTSEMGTASPHPPQCPSRAWPVVGTKPFLTAIMGQVYCIYITDKCNSCKINVFEMQYVINKWCMSQIRHFKLWGVYVLGVYIRGVCVLGGICPGGKCPGGKCPGGYMSGSKCSGGTYQFSLSCYRFEHIISVSDMKKLTTTATSL